jgi:hypothetical protein
MLPVGVAIGAADEELFPIDTALGEESDSSVDLRGRDTPVEMGTHVVGFGRRGVVDIAADIAVVIIVAQLRVIDDLGEPIDVGKGAESGDDLLLVLWPQHILRFAFGVLAIRVDEQHLAAPFGRLRPLRSQDQDRSWDAGAVKQVRAKADHGIEQVILYDPAANLTLDATPKEHPVWHDGSDDAVGL